MQQKRMAYALLWSNPPSPISTRDTNSHRSSPPSPLSPTRDIEVQCLSLPSPKSPTRDTKGQCPSLSSPISPTRDIKSQFSTRSSSRERFYVRYLSKECIHQSCKFTNAAGKNGVATSNHNFYAQIRHRQYLPPGISIANAPISHRQYHPPGISNVNAPFRHIQYAASGISNVNLQLTMKKKVLFLTQTL
ncbi:hypothetical protein PoB_003648900 [Plakobranchus ocellatus]|uniref:Uncharacterized protein n=1 Tax=Plakobranchus ocellatus TaxID=259542 RepID=A0AAV4AUJ4_9GAST|nr:hypothetical protein PoB_003648900 [Plakobranchus ocellatus]